MALAILDLLDVGDAHARFRADTGTSRYFRVRLGHGVREAAGFDWIDRVVHETPLQVNPKGGGLLDTATVIAVPLGSLEEGRAVAQLFSFKTREGRSPAFSALVPLDTAMRIPDADFVLPESSEMEQVLHTPTAFRHSRAVPCRTHAEQFSAPAIGDLLTQLVKVAAPVVMGFLQQPPAGGAVTPPAAGAGAGATPPAAGGGGLSATLVGLLEAILKQIPGLAPTSKTQSVFTAASAANRFREGNGAPLSRPFIFGIDDVLIGAAIGQVIGVLPELANAAVQKRVQLQQSQNKLLGDIVSEVQRRMMLQQVLDAQGQAPAAQQPDIAQLAALLQQAGAAPVQSLAAPPAQSQSLALQVPTATPSARATATFITAPPVAWNGREHVLLSKGRDVRLDVRLVVGDPAPSKPLPKSIVRVVIKRPSDQSVIAEKVVKQRDLPAGGSVAVNFTAAELATAPPGEPLSLLAEIRWLTAGGREIAAAGAAEAVFVERYFLKERGSQAGPERELTDMDRYRAFWNKVWESPVLDAAAGSDRKLLWGLDATLKYSVLAVGDQPSNGMMETRFLTAAADSDSVSARTEGRMKSGVELSIDELNKLAPLWDDQAPLDVERLAALRGADAMKAAGGEVVQRVTLRGSAAERGLVWVVPVFSPVEFTLGAVQSADDAGQVTAVTEERVRLAAAGRRACHRVEVRRQRLGGRDREGVDGGARPTPSTGIGSSCPRRSR